MLYTPQIFPKSNFLLENAENRNMSSTGKNVLVLNVRPYFSVNFTVFKPLRAWARVIDR